jgi:nucleoside-diphosphate-sugar epimerase
MGKHVVVGAGQVGAEVVRSLSALGHEVVVATRSGSGPDLPGVRRVAVNATDSAELIQLTKGADALYNCVNPLYHRWLTDWPPIAESLLATAEATGAGYVILGNLYVYGEPHGPLTESSAETPSSAKAKVRLKLWRDALAAHRAGRIRATELRASDYFGPGSRDQSHLGDRFMPNLLAGKPVRLPGDPDQPHSWSYVRDVATALVTAGLHDRSWGRVWHAPTAPPMTYRQMAVRVHELAGTPAPPKVGSIPQWVIDLMGLAVPMMGEIKHVRYQFDRPFVIDSTAFQQTFGVEPTPIDEALKATIDWWRTEARA